VRLGQLAGDDTRVPVLLERLEADRPEQLLGSRELREEPFEVAAAEGLRDGAHERALRGAGWPDEQDVIARENGAERTVDDLAALGEAGVELLPELVDRAA